MVDMGEIQRFSVFLSLFIFLLPTSTAEHSVKSFQCSEQACAAFMFVIPVLAER